MAADLDGGSGSCFAFSPFCYCDRRAIYLCLGLVALESARGNHAFLNRIWITINYLPPVAQTHSLTAVERPSHTRPTEIAAFYNTTLPGTMKFITPLFVLATLGQAAKQGDFDELTEAIKPLAHKAKCALPCLLSGLNNAKAQRVGEPIFSTICNQKNRNAVTKSVDDCLERKCRLGGVARM